MRKPASHNYNNSAGNVLMALGYAALIALAALLVFG
jgi:hypothetical protein